MVAGAAEYLNYELYKDTGHATIWGDTADTALDVPAAPNRNPRNFSVYGRVRCRHKTPPSAPTPIPSSRR